MIDAIAAALYRYPDALLALSRLESRAIAKHTAAITIQKPIYVMGLARSGTTVTLEFIAANPAMVSHSYADYPFLFTPYWWHRINRLFSSNSAKMERAHRDGIMVNTQSPESMEEMIWAHFFPWAHDISTSHCLNASHRNPAFDVFYADHIRKLLYAKSGSRYVSKANYNLSRIPYLLSLFPDAKIVMLMREPEAFVASSIKQDLLFCAEQKAKPATRTHTGVMQHFEFGLDKRPINFGDHALTRQIATQMDEPAHRVSAWAHYWVAAYQHIADLLAQPAYASHMKLVRYEDICAQPANMLQEILDFCEMEADGGLVHDFAATLQAPTYYTPHFSDADRAAIRDVAHETAQGFGY